MAEPVRLRGEVGEGAYCLSGTFYDRRNNPFASSRVDAIVAHFKAALAELQEQSRADRAEVAGLRDEIARLKGEARLLTALVCDTAALAKGQPEGCHE